MSNGEIYIELAVVVTKVHPFPAEPDVGQMEGGLEIEGQEYYDGDTLITDKKLIAALDDHVLKHCLDKLQEAAEEAYAENCEADAAEQADWEHERWKDRRHGLV